MRFLKTWLLVLALALFPSQGLAALAVDAVAGAYNRLTITTVSYSHTTSGSDRALVVGIAYRNGTTRTITVTYNGVSMADLGGSNNGNTRTRQFALSNPASGTNTVLVTFSGTVDFASVGSVSLTGAHQTTASLTGTQATGTGQSLNVSSATGEIVVDVIGHVGSGVHAVGAGQTQIWNQGNYTNDFFGGAGSYEAGATTTTMSWTGGGGPTDLSHAGVSVKPAGAGGPPVSAVGRRRVQ